jgi:hypothetical protein
MIDRKALKLAEQVDRLVSASSPAIVEGAVLVEVVENGVAKVLVKGTVAGTDKIAGFAILPYSRPDQAVDMEQFVVPSSGSLIFNLRYNNLVADSERAAVIGGSDLTVDPDNFSSTPSTGTVKVDELGGRLKFAAGDAGKVVNFIYRHALTVQQANQRFQERSINNRDLVADLQQVGVAKGYVEISTDQFDSSKDYTQGTALTLGDGGIITQGGSGPAIPQAKVLAAPDLSGTAQGAFLRISAMIG